MMRLLGALICVFALTPTYAQDWTHYKEAKQAKLKPTQIGEAGNGTFTLQQAIALIGKETGNPVEPEKVTAAPEGTRDLVLQGLSFWEAIEAIEGQWKLDAAILRRAWDRGVTPPQPLEGEVIQERIVDCFRITMTVTEKIPFKAFKGPDGAYRYLMVQLESEPRLPLFAAVKCKYDAVDTEENTAHDHGTPMNRRWGNVNRLPFNLLEDYPQQVRLRLDLEYHLDWRFRKVGPLSRLTPGKKKQIAKYKFNPGELGEGEHEGRRWLRVSLFERTSLLDSSDLALHLEDGTVLVATEFEPHGSATFADVPENLPLSKIYLHVRAPHKTKSKSLKLNYDKDRR